MIVPRDFESSTVDSYQYLRFGQTEDIWLKLALEGTKGSLLITEEVLGKRGAGFTCYVDCQPEVQLFCPGSMDL